MMSALCENDGRVGVTGREMFGDSMEGVTGLDETGDSEYVTSLDDEDVFILLTLSLCSLSKGNSGE